MLHASITSLWLNGVDPVVYRSCRYHDKGTWYSDAERHIELLVRGDGFLEFHLILAPWSYLKRQERLLLLQGYRLATNGEDKMGSSTYDMDCAKDIVSPIVVELSLHFSSLKTKYR